MITSMQTYVLDLMRRFHSEEEGLALTEYLVLLGLLTGALILAIIAFGGALSDVWEAWTLWITNNLSAPADL